MTSSTKSDDLFRQATRAWETAAEAGVKMQEECAKWVRQMFCESSTFSGWYEKGQKVMHEAIAKSQENVDEAIRLMNQQAEASLKLIHVCAGIGIGCVLGTAIEPVTCGPRSWSPVAHQARDRLQHGGVGDSYRGRMAPVGGCADAATQNWLIWAPVPDRYAPRLLAPIRRSALDLVLVSGPSGNAGSIRA